MCRIFARFRRTSSYANRSCTFGRHSRALLRMRSTRRHCAMRLSIVSSNVSCTVYGHNRRGRRRSIDKIVLMCATFDKCVATNRYRSVTMCRMSKGDDCGRWWRVRSVVLDMRSTLSSELCASVDCRDTETMRRLAMYQLQDMSTVQVS
jgi:hypothetical protein